VARQRLELIHLATSGYQSVDAACAELGICPSYFDKLRTRAYLGAALALTPRAGGRRRTQAVVLAAELHEAQRQIAELQRENTLLRAQNELAPLRANEGARRPKSPGRPRHAKTQKAAPRSAAQ
jgi:transposase-like protein